MNQSYLPIKVRKSLEPETAGYYLKVASRELGLPQYLNQKITIYADPHDKVNWGDLVVMWDEAGQYHLRAVLPVLKYSGDQPCGAMLQSLAQSAMNGEPPVFYHPGKDGLPIVHRIIGIEWPRGHGPHNVMATQSYESRTGINIWVEG